MRFPRSLLVALLAAFAVGTGVARAGDGPAPRLCIVEASTSLFTDSEFQRELVARLGSFGPVERVSGSVAADRLRSGECDAVIVLGPTRPSALRRLTATTVAGSLGPDRHYAPVSLILSEGETPVHKSLLATFPRALRESVTRPVSLYAGQ